jgi:hypothetical protein
VKAGESVILHLAVMPSRKKARGRARRAAKEAKAAEEVDNTAVVADGSIEAQMQRLAINNSLRESDAVQVQKCRHGFELEGNEERLCVEFVKVFSDAVIANKLAGDNGIRNGLLSGSAATEEKFGASVINDATKLKGVISCLVAHSVQNILDGDGTPNRLETASLACYFEQYIEVMIEETQTLFNMSRIAELQWADINTLVNYLRKRIPCKCLDKKYKEVKSIIKMGLCGNPACSLPDRQVERKKMFKCTGGCSGTYYCSYECQKADWKRHKEKCKRWARE